ncbi:hypothetical protein [Streptomyces sp. NPDC048644]
MASWVTCGGHGTAADGGPQDAAPRAHGEWSRHWRCAGLPGLDLLRAR